MIAIGLWGWFTSTRAGKSTGKQATKRNGLPVPFFVAIIRDLYYCHCTRACHFSGTVTPRKRRFVSFTNDDLPLFLARDCRRLRFGLSLSGSPPPFLPPGSRADNNPPTEPPAPSVTKDTLRPDDRDFPFIRQGRQRRHRRCQYIVRRYIDDIDPLQERLRDLRYIIDIAYRSLRQSKSRRFACGAEAFHL